MLAYIGIYMWNVGLLKDGIAALETAEKVLKDLNLEKDDLMSEIDIPLGIIYEFIGVSRRKEALSHRQAPNWELRIQDHGGFPSLHQKLDT